MSLMTHPVMVMKAAHPPEASRRNGQTSHPQSERYSIFHDTEGREEALE